MNLINLLVFTERHIPRGEAPTSHMVRAVRHVQLLPVAGVGDRVQPRQHPRHGRDTACLHHLRLRRHLVEVIAHGPRRRRLVAPLIHSLPLFPFIRGEVLPATFSPLFNSNPMISQYLQLVEYSQRYFQLC